MYRALGRGALAREFCVLRLRRAGQRVCESGTCHRQEVATAGTVFHWTRTDLSKWFLAACLMGRHNRRVSAKFPQRELGVGAPDGLDPSRTNCARG
jgi:hypothetical protein